VQLEVAQAPARPGVVAVTGAFPPATHLLLRAGARSLYVATASPPEPGGSAAAGSSDATAALSVEQQNWLGVRPGGVVEAEPVTLPRATAVKLLPLFPEEGATADPAGLGSWLARDAVPLRVGSRFRAPGQHGPDALYEVLEVQAPGGVAVLGPDARCELATVTASSSEQDWGASSLEDVPGLSRQVRQISQLVRTPIEQPWRYRRLGLTPPTGLILHGPPGAGKTFLAQATARSLGVHTEFVSGAELVYGGRGESEANLRSIFSRAVRNAPSIVLVDEIDAVVPTRARLDAQADYRLVAQFLTLLDGLKRLEGVILIGTTNLLSNIDPALRRPGRLDLELYVGPPDRDEREQVLAWYLDRMPLSAEARQATGALADRTWGYLPADLMAVCRQAGLIALAREQAGGDGADELVTVRDLDRAAAQVQPSMLRGVATVAAPTRTLDDLVLGPERLKSLSAAVDAAVEQARPLRLLVTDEDGRGREVMEAVAATFGQRLLVATPTDFVSPWFGETEGNIRDFFALSRAVAPVTVGLMHLDGLTGGPSRAGDAGLERACAQLLEELRDDRAGVNVVATVGSADGVDRRLLATFTVV
jgi:transitional endoplasmic reticulum ATPase